MTIKEKKTILKTLSPYCMNFNQLFYWLKIDNVEVKKDKLKSYLTILIDKGFVRQNYDVYSTTALGEEYLNEK